MDERSTRKKQLIAEGALHRAELLLAREALQDAIRPEALGRSTLRHLLNGVAGSFGRGAHASSGFRLQAVLPLLMSALPMLKAGRQLFKGVLGIGTFASMAAGVAAFMRRKNKPASSD